MKNNKVSYISGLFKVFYKNLHAGVYVYLITMIFIGIISLGTTEPWFMTFPYVFITHLPLIFVIPLLGVVLFSFSLKYRKDEPCLFDRVYENSFSVENINAEKLKELFNASGFSGVYIYEEGGKTIVKAFHGYEDVVTEKRKYKASASNLYCEIQQTSKGYQFQILLEPARKMQKIDFSGGRHYIFEKIKKNLHYKTNA